MFAAFSGFYPTIKPPLRARARFKIYISRAKTRIENSRRRNFWPTGEKLFERQERILSCAIISIRDRICDLCLARFFSPRFLFVVDLERRGENLSRTIEREREQNLSSRVLRFFRPRLNITDKMWLPVYWILARFVRFRRKGNLQCTLSTRALLSVVLFLSSRFVISRIYMYIHVYAFAITFVSRHWFTIRSPTNSSNLFVYTRVHTHNVKAYHARRTCEKP